MDQPVKVQGVGENDKGRGPQTISPVQEKTGRSVNCVYCGDQMASVDVPRFNRGFGIAILVMGLLVSIFSSVVFGLPVMVIGAYMGVASRPVWMCRACAAVVDRHGT